MGRIPRKGKLFAAYCAENERDILRSSGHADAGSIPHRNRTDVHISDALNPQPLIDWRPILALYAIVRSSFYNL
ncbi:MAG: hypothetical protein CO125_08115 [Hydrogenophilales bacterium CG_4_9_14_3_um_filter_59_35]|nr:MAG: hypothetical protein COW70_14000 [Hydrogenophilales bacterium CG18_big_fil_WC_8_21_14_2_50_58_12]PIX99041.1 MAG: hypothetical protein COZ23_12280 [Hydrogenophilales bacterium CG_4_10_14_3_um_filter_58_23]PJB05970.1 MAG: hypothetical protein CO125_08115 [Hydrogenophilales bacterium CG_4_9_14_3_um_filter_59_35]